MGRAPPAAAHPRTSHEVDEVAEPGVQERLAAHQLEDVGAHVLRHEREDALGLGEPEEALVVERRHGVAAPAAQVAVLGDVELERLDADAAVGELGVFPPIGAEVLALLQEHRLERDAGAGLVGGQRGQERDAAVGIDVPPDRGLERRPVLGEGVHDAEGDQVLEAEAVLDALRLEVELAGEDAELVDRAVELPPHVERRRSWRARRAPRRGADEEALATMADDRRAHPAGGRERVAPVVEQPRRLARGEDLDHELLRVHEHLARRRRGRGAGPLAVGGRGAGGVAERRDPGPAPRQVEPRPGRERGVDRRARPRRRRAEADEIGDREPDLAAGALFGLAQRQLAQRGDAHRRLPLGEPGVDERARVVRGAEHAALVEPARLVAAEDLHQAPPAARSASSASRSNLATARSSHAR